MSNESGGMIERSGSGIHRCTPPMGDVTLDGDITREPYGTIWRCDCGHRYEVVIGRWGKTWKRLWTPFWLRFKNEDFA